MKDGEGGGGWTGWGRATRETEPGSLYEPTELQAAGMGEGPGPSRAKSTKVPSSTRGTKLVKGWLG
jgi:hypothetical protein